MAKNNDSTVGLALMGGLPDDDGLSPLAESLDNKRTSVVYAVALINVDHVIERVRTDTATVKARIIQIEASGLTKEEQDALKRILDAAHTRRTGSRAMIGSDGSITEHDDPDAAAAKATTEGTPDAPSFSDKPAPAKAAKAAKAPKASPVKAVPNAS